MKRATFHTSMSEPMRLFVEDRLETGGYPSVSEYIRGLIRIDQWLEYDRLCAAIGRQRSGAESGRPTGYRMG